MHDVCSGNNKVEVLVIVMTPVLLLDGGSLPVDETMREALGTITTAERKTRLFQPMAACSGAGPTCEAPQLYRITCPLKSTPPTVDAIAMILPRQAGAGFGICYG